MLRMAIVIVLALALAACGKGDKTWEQVAPDSIPDKVTYSEHVKPVLDYYCAGCHYSSTKSVTFCDLEGGIDFSTYVGAKNCFGELVFVVFEEKIMPPGFWRQLTPLHKRLLEKWEEGGFLE